MKGTNEAPNRKSRVVAVCLLVDDESEFVMFAEWEFSKLGLDVVFAHTSDEAFALLAEPDGPKLALIDQDLSVRGGSVTGGSDLVMLLRSRTNGSLVLLALTSSAKPDDREAFKEAGADGYVSKGRFAEFAPYVALLAEGKRIPADIANELMDWVSPRIVDE